MEDNFNFLKNASLDLANLKPDDSLDYRMYQKRTSLLKMLTEDDVKLVNEKFILIENKKRELSLDLLSFIDELGKKYNEF